MGFFKDFLTFFLFGAAIAVFTASYILGHKKGEKEQGANRPDFTGMATLFGVALGAVFGFAIGSIGTVLGMAIGAAVGAAAELFICLSKRK